MKRLHTFLGTLSLCLCVAFQVNAASYTFLTYNIDGTHFKNRGALFKKLANTSKPDIIFFQELLSKKQLDDFLKKSGLTNWHGTISDFRSDSVAESHHKLEVGVASHYKIKKVIEVDSILDNDDDTNDIQLRASKIIPKKQRTYIGRRGYLWVEFPKIKLVAISVHLKSSRGAFGKDDEKNSMEREVVISSVAERILNDQKKRGKWNYVLAGDFNIAPCDESKVGVKLSHKCKSKNCKGYDQTHAILNAGLFPGLVMRNLTQGITRTYKLGGKGYPQCPIDNVYAIGPLFDEVVKITVERLGRFGSDHHAVMIKIEVPE